MAHANAIARLSETRDAFAKMHDPKHEDLIRNIDDQIARLHADSEIDTDALRAKRAPASHPKPALATCDDLRRTLTHYSREIAPIIRGYVERALAPLEKRILELEQRPQVRWCGTWKSEVPYRECSLTTDHGALWLACNDVKGERPGTGPGWRLVAKSFERDR